MHKVLRQLLSSAAIVGAVLSPTAQAAVVVNFEGDALTGLYFPGDSFVQSGFKMTAGFDFGTVDTAAALGTAAPSGNSTQFYFNSNDGELIIERDGGGLFDLNGFSAAFVPLVPPANQPTVIVALGTYADSTAIGAAFLYPASSGGVYPFGSYTNPAYFTNFTGLKMLEFFSCSYNGSSVCTAPTQNNGQFAIDDISLTAAVPEPSTVALVMLGLLGVGLRSRRNAR